MKRNTLVKLITFAVLLVLVVVLACVLKTDVPGADSRYFGTFMALIPPVIAIVCALVTKEVYSSLFIGILAGGLFAAEFNPVGTFDAVVIDGLIAAVSDTAGIFLFLVLLGGMVALLNSAGGSRAFGHWAQKHVKTRVGALLATVVLGVLIFVDDYFNCLTVGSVMRPVTDLHKVSRTKLAYVIDATAAPVCMIAPISSWAAAVTDYVPDNQGLAYFIKAIPFNFYSLMTLLFVVLITLLGYDYGKMAEFELRARNGEEDNTAEMVEKGRSRVIDLVIPIAVLIVSCVLSLVYVGGFFDKDSGCYHSIINSFGATDATVGLPFGAVIALLFTVIYMIARRLLSFEGAMKCIPQGFIAMVPAITILTLATSLKNITALLGSDIFVDNLLADAEVLKGFLPAIVFLIACFISFSTGTSWGTFGILIPIVLTVFDVTTPIGTIAMSACLAGSVVGDHCSPISDTTIMASAGAECNHVDHVSTQMPYVLTVATISFIGYLLAAVPVFRHWYVLLPIEIILTVGTVLVLRKLHPMKKAESK